MSQYFHLVKQNNQEIIDLFKNVILTCCNKNAFIDVYTLKNEVKKYMEENIINKNILENIDFEVEGDQEILIQLNHGVFNSKMILKYYIELNNKNVFFESITFFNKESLLSFGFADKYNTVSISAPYSGDIFGIIITSHGKNLSFLSNGSVSNKLPNEISHIGFFKSSAFLSEKEPLILLKYLYENSTLTAEERDLCKLTYDIDLSDNLFSVCLKDLIFNNKYEMKTNKTNILTKIKKAIF